MRIAAAFINISAILLFNACSQQPLSVVSGGTANATASFSSIEANVFRSECIRCHSSANPNGGVALDSYSAVMSSSFSGQLIVLSGNAEQSTLYTSVQSGAMPLGGPTLPSSAIGAIHDWIQSGAQND